MGCCPRVPKLQGLPLQLPQVSQQCCSDASIPGLSHYEMSTFLRFVVLLQVNLSTLQQCALVPLLTLYAGLCFEECKAVYGRTEAEKLCGNRAASGLRDASRHAILRFLANFHFAEATSKLSCCLASCCHALGLNACLAPICGFTLTHMHAAVIRRGTKGRAVSLPSWKHLW